MRNCIGLVLIGALLAFGGGCSDDGGGTAGTGGSAGTGGTGGSEGLCPTAGQTVTLPGEISESVTLTADCTYRVAQTVFVTGGTMTIEEGTKVIGDNTAGLVITKNATIEAQGSANAPVVFTSSAPVGSRQPGNWGGVVLLGSAPLSWGNAACGGDTGVVCENFIEGLPEGENRGTYGGDDPTSDCGTLRYVRIEFAGYPLTPGNELNSLTLGGCGTDTTLEYIQVHQGEDDGVEIFGGTVSISKFIVSVTGDDGLDWDQGWQGSATNFIVDHTSPRSDDPRGIEGDNFSDNPDVEPRSNPTVTNGTILGSAGSDAGIVLRRGTIGTLSGLVVTDWDGPGINVIDSGWDPAWPTSMSVSATCFWSNDPDYPIDEDDPNTAGDAFFDEPTELADGLGNTTDEDPEIADRAAHDYAVGNSNCAGAFAPSGEDWTTGGWTDYPAN